MSARLRLRRGVVVAERPLTVEIDGEPRPAWADTTLLGEMREGDEVVVNVAALDLRLGSGGFDVVHVNLSRGVGGDARAPDAPASGVSAPASGASVAAGEPPHVMKLNYTSLQHSVDPIENWRVGAPGGTQPANSPAALVLPLHGHLAPAAWVLARVDPGIVVGYVQTAGGALPGSLSRDVAELRERGLLAGHVSAAPAYGGDHEAISVVGALDAAVGLGWDVAVVGPGPGIIGSGSSFGHGGMAALDSAHAALSIGMRTTISPRLSSTDPRERHRGLSHHTLTILELLLAPVEIAVPEGVERWPAGEEAGRDLRAAAGERHELIAAPAAPGEYAESGLPARTMGRGIDEDPLFFAAPLAAGAAVAGAALRGKG